MRCQMCNAMLDKKMVSIVRKKNRLVVTYSNIPVLICPVCREQYLEVDEIIAGGGEKSGIPRNIH